MAEKKVRLESVIRQANENGQFIFSGKENKNQLFFKGVFSYEGYNTDRNNNTFRQHFSNANATFLEEPDYRRFKVNHVSLNKDWFLKYWPEEKEPHSIYNIEDLSFSFFISNLIDTLANKSVTRNNFIWYASDKELNRVLQF